MKKLVSMLLIVSMVTLLFAGCGTKSTQSGANTDTKEKEVKKQDIKEKETKKEPVTLHVIHWKQLGQNVIDKFQKENPNVTIQFENFPIDKFSQVIKTRIASNELPDLFGAVESDFPIMVKENIFAELTNESFLNNYDSSVINDLKTWTRSDGKVFTIPTDSYIVGIWINKDMFKNNNIKIPENYDEYVAAVEAFNAKGITPFVQGGKDAWPLVQSVYELYRLDVQNPEFFDKLKTGETKWTDEPVIDALTEYQEVYSKNLLPGSMGLTYPQSFEAFAQQKVAMWNMGSWATEFLKNSDGTPKKLDFELGFIPGYENKAGEPTVAAGFKLGAQWGIWSKSKNIDVAKSLLAFITKPENTVEFMKGSGTIMPIKGVKAGDIIPGANLTFDVMLNTPCKPSPIISTSPGIEGLYNKAIQDICMGKSVKEEMEKLQKAQETANKENK